MPDRLQPAPDRSTVHQADPARVRGHEVAECEMLMPGRTRRYQPSFPAIPDPQIGEIQLFHRLTRFGRAP
jgi:hypothetical protein